MRILLVSVYALVTMGLVSCSNSDLDTSNIVEVKEHNEVVAKKKAEEEAKRKAEEEQRQREEEERRRQEEENALYPLEKYLLENYDTNKNGSLEVTEVEEIISLDVSNRKLTDLVGVEKLINLEVLNASNNRLTSIPTTFPTMINNLNISSNRIKILDISFFGRYFATGSTKFDVTNNPDLRCIKVNSTQERAANRLYKDNWKKDTTAEFSTACN